MRHNFKVIEKKWQKKWEDAKVFEAQDFSDKKKFYGLVEFPYPSGAGMHVGHIKAYSSVEVVSRKRRMEGYNVLFPIGFDAFGLPTENYAIKTGTHPRQITDQNIARFTEQLKRVGFSFDWSRVIDTTDEKFYKWTQWIFLKMFEKGLVFRDTALVNYCPSCKVVLSNEDSQGGKCDICHSEVVQKSKTVWYLKITEYADKLLQGLKDVDYPANVKQQQENWIGKSTGAFVNFDVDGTDEKLQIYTTRPDTLFGVTFMVIAPEHPLIDKYADKITNMDAIKAYRTECQKKTEFERTQLVKDKTGVKIEGLMGINPMNGKKIPIFIADYVMMGYGTGAIMAVPAHDQRDYDFAKAWFLRRMSEREHDVIEDLMGVRYVVLNEMMLHPTPAEVERFRYQNDKLFKLTQECYAQCRNMWRTLFHTPYKVDDRYRYEVEGVLRFEYGDDDAVVKMENDDYYGSDFQYMIHLLDELMSAGRCKMDTILNGVFGTFDGATEDGYK